MITGHGNVLYGTRISEVVNLITKASIGGGKKKTYNDYGYGEYEDVIKYLNFGITAGTPLQLNRNVYFTPSVGWYYNRAKQDNYTQVTSGVVVNMNMDFFMGKGDDQCDLSDRPIPISQRYNQGDFHLGSRMFGRFKTEHAEGTSEEKSSIFKWQGGLGYNYYVSEHFSLSPIVGYGNWTSKDKDTDVKTSTQGIYAGIGWNYHITPN